MQKDVMIYRQAAIDMLSLGKEILSRVLDDIDVVGTDREKYSWGLELIESNIKDIEELPSAQPERKKGKWIDMGDFEQCSACTGTHLKEVNTVYGKATWIKSAFCPNCGADMR